MTKSPLRFVTGHAYGGPMSNVIRPTFGAPSRGATPSAKAPVAEEYRPLRVYGTAAGHLVALLRDDAASEGPVFRVVVGPEDGNTVETVVIMPATAEGEADADTAAMAVLRALEVVESGGGGTVA